MRHLTLSTAKQLAEKFDKVRVDRLESLAEFRTRAFLDFAKRFFGRGNTIDDVLPLRREE